MSAKPIWINLGGNHRRKAFEHDALTVLCPTHGPEQIRHCVHAGFQLVCGCEFSHLLTCERKNGVWLLETRKRRSQKR